MLLIGRATGRSARRAVERVAILTARAELAFAAADLETARGTYRRARTIASQNGGESLAGALLGLAHCHRRLAEWSQAAECLDEAEALPALSLPTLAAIKNARGVLAKDIGRFADAERHYASAMATLTSSDLASLWLRATLEHNLAGLAHAQLRHAEAERPARAAVALRRRHPDASDLDVALDEVVLAAVLAGQGKLDEAETLVRGALATWTTLFDPEHYEVAVCLNNLADIHLKRDRHADAERCFREARRVKIGVLGAAHPEVAVQRRHGLNPLGAMPEHGIPTRDQVPSPRGASS